MVPLWFTRRLFRMFCSPVLSRRYLRWVTLNRRCAPLSTTHPNIIDLLNDFSDFLTSILTDCDRVLIVGGFNIHVCCPEKMMMKDFLSLTDSLVQWVDGPTHEHGHTVDLVFSQRLSVINLEIWQFDFCLVWCCFFAAVKSCVPVECCRVFNPSTAGHFFCCLWLALCTFCFWYGAPSLTRVKAFWTRWLYQNWCALRPDLSSMKELVQPNKSAVRWTEMGKGQVTGFISHSKWLSASQSKHCWKGQKRTFTKHWYVPS